MNPKFSITKEKARELFDYVDGKLIWVKPSKQKPQLLGKEAGYTKKTGYKEVCIEGVKIMVHRVIYIWHFGEFVGFLDHIDGDISNNKIENLRKATREENNRNAGIRKDNKSGFKGVRWRKDVKKWQAFIRVNKKGIHLGYYTDIKDAIKAYETASLKYHNTFSVFERSKKKMRCQCCNEILSNYEVTLRHAVTKKFIEMCGNCLKDTNIPIQVRNDLLSEVDLDMVEELLDGDDADFYDDMPDDDYYKDMWDER